MFPDVISSAFSSPSPVRASLRKLLRDGRRVKAVATLATKAFGAVVLERLTEKTDPSATPPVVVDNGTRRSCLTSPTTTLCGRPPQRASTPARESDRSGFVAALADGAAPVPFRDSVLRK